MSCPAGDSHEPQGFSSVFQQLLAKSPILLFDLVQGIHTGYYCGFCDFGTLSAFLWESHISLATHELLLKDLRPITLVCHDCGIMMLLEGSKLHYFDLPCHLRLDAKMKYIIKASSKPGPVSFENRFSPASTKDKFPTIDTALHESVSKNVSNFDLKSYSWISSCRPPGDANDQISFIGTDDRFSFIMDIPVLHGNLGAAKVLPPFGDLLKFNSLYDFKSNLVYSCDLCKCKGSFELNLFVNHIKLSHFSSNHTHFNLMIFICEVCKLIALTNDHMKFLCHLQTPSHVSKSHRSEDLDSFSIATNSSLGSKLSLGSSWETLENKVGKHAFPSFKRRNISVEDGNSDVLHACASTSLGMDSSRTFRSEQGSDEEDNEDLISESEASEQADQAALPLSLPDCETVECEVGQLESTAQQRIELLEITDGTLLDISFTCLTCSYYTGLISSSKAHLLDKQHIKKRPMFCTKAYMSFCIPCKMYIFSYSEDLMPHLSNCNQSVEWVKDAKRPKLIKQLCIAEKSKCVIF